MRMVYRHTSDFCKSIQDR